MRTANTDWRTTYRLKYNKKHNEILEDIKIDFVYFSNSIWSQFVILLKRKIYLYFIRKKKETKMKLAKRKTNNLKWYHAQLSLDNELIIVRYELMSWGCASIEGKRKQDEEERKWIEKKCANLFHVNKNNGYYVNTQMNRSTDLLWCRWCKSDAKRIKINVNKIENKFQIVWIQ